MKKKTKPTLIEVAKEAGVHFATASRALDPARSHLVKDATRAKVQRAVAELGYSANLAARGLRTGKTQVIGFCVADFFNPFLAPIVKGAEDVLAAENYWTIVFATHDESGALEGSISRLKSRGIDGLIISAARYTDLKFIREIAEEMPVVLAVRDLGTREFFSVTQDDKLGGRLATQHLADLGHSQLAEIRGPQDVSSFKGRSGGFRYEVKKRGLTDLSTIDQKNHPTIQGGYAAAKRILESGNIPTAVFAHNDMMAVGAIEAFSEAKIKCPRDISIVGYNDSPLTANISPPLTTVRLSGSKVGEVAAEHLLTLLRGEKVSPVVDRLAPLLVVRQSTKKLGAP